MSCEKTSGWALASRGIKLMLNNKVVEARELLSDDSSNLQLQAGYCYLTFMNAVMTFEEEDMSHSLGVLRAMEKRCHSQLTWTTSFSSLRSRMQGILGGGREQQTDDNEASLRLEQQIIMADCQVLAAILNFLQQDWGSYMKGGWVLRKAWKIYQRTYTNIRTLYIKRCGFNPGSLVPPPASCVEAPPTDDKKDKIQSNNCQRPDKGRVSHSFSVPLSLFNAANQTVPITNSGQDIPTEDISRLMSAVSFGYGLFQLAVSLLPSRLINMVHFLGFEGDRRSALQSLLFARQGNDMRAPLATLGLLWFHTIVRPFFCLDGSNNKMAADAAQRLIDSSKPEFESSALFLFFQGRVDRLRSNLVSALCSYELALSVSCQREVRLLCLHEVGWSHVLLLQWVKAAHAFSTLRTQSRWSQAFYCYLSAVCEGSAGNIELATDLITETADLLQKSNNQLDKFLIRRSTRLREEELEQEHFLLLGYELLYLWNALTSTSLLNKQSIGNDCQQMGVGILEGVRQLCLGVMEVDTGDTCRGMEHLKEAILYGEQDNDIHIAAFASLELGTLLSKDNQTLAEGRTLLEYARDNYQNFDFENRLNVRIQAVLKNLDSQAQTHQVHQTSNQMSL